MNYNVQDDDRIFFRSSTFFRKWLAPAIQVALTVWLVELLSMSRICQGHTPEENHSQHGRNIDPNLLLERVVTLLAKGFMENEQNFESSLLLSRIKDSVETIGLRPPGTVRNPIKNCNCNLLPPASPQQ